MSEASRPSRPDWLPDFCSLPVIGSLIVIVELVVAVIVIAPDQQQALPRLREFLGASFAAQWIALLSAVVLCKLSPRLALWPRRLAIVIGVLLPVIVSVAGGFLLGQIDVSLGFKLVPASTTLSQFVLGIALLTALTSIVVLRYFYVQERWKRQAAAQARAQLDALHARIRPHFLFNTLNTAASLIEVAPRQAEQAILDLSELFRAALSPEGIDWPLSSELELTRRYLEIEQLRLGHRLKVELDLPESLADVPVPQLCLQPLVENAIHHGIQAVAEGGTVRVRAESQGAFVMVTVENPKPKVALPSARTRGNHIALGNIRDRLRLRYGDDAQLLSEDLGDQYRATLILPK
ncbi:MAG: histidine kinase [Ahniella sp.]|nr:histidine kinase [Ahniella sp.]